MYITRAYDRFRLAQDPEEFRGTMNDLDNAIYTALHILDMDVIYLQNEDGDFDQVIYRDSIYLTKFPPKRIVQRNI